METAVEIGHRCLRVCAEPERPCFVMSGAEAVARLAYELKLCRVVAGESVRKVEGGLIHRIPERVVVVVWNDIHPRAPHGELVGLVAQIYPTRRCASLFGCIRVAVSEHFADAAQGNDNPVFLLIGERLVEQIEVGNHSKHAVLGTAWHGSRSDLQMITPGWR